MHNATANGAAIRSLSHHLTNDKVFSMVRGRLVPGARLLDVGAGEGYFSKVVGDYLDQQLSVEPSSVVSACDVAPEIYRYPRVRCERIGSGATLPYHDAEFDVVCSLEVIEHVEDQFQFCREIVRVLKPGGIAVLSTPNVLNLNSRYRGFHSGFATLFNPLSPSAPDAVHTSGHINPISYYYLAYALTLAGAATVSVEFDRFKRSAALLYLLAWPIVWLGNAGFRMRLRRKHPALLAENRQLLRDMQSMGMLTSRSIVVRVTK
jgi:2-polyprenyl-3-methyl-5-hydroxy-6-metoxy-1,4-benzoquinol methylase